MARTRYWVVGMIGLLAWPVAALDWSAVKQDIARRYPHVRQLPAADLAEWLATTNRPPPLLLDVRSPAEFAVSHLQGARRVDPDSAPGRVLAGTPRDTPIVVYCSVGYRSSRYAERLRRAGFTHVWQLDGSIFEWANAGRPLVRGEQPTTSVHPYNAHWGQLLNSQRQAVRP